MSQPDLGLCICKLHQMSVFGSDLNILCCIIAASTEIVEDMVVKLQQPNVALVHQMPFALQANGMASAIEKVSVANICS